MTSPLMTSKIRFEVFRRAGKTLMGNFLDYTHIVQSICNISEIASRKTQGGVLGFGLSIL